MGSNLLKHINFLRLYYKFLNLFLIVPWYDFSKNGSSHPKLAKIYGFVLIACKITIVIFAYSDQQIHILYQQIAFSQKFIMILLIIILNTITIYTILNTAFLNPNKWVKLFKNLHWVDKNFGVIEQKQQFTRRFIEQFILKHIFFIIVWSYQVCIWTSVMQMPWYKVFWLMGYQDVVFECLLITLIATLVTSIKNKYKNLSKKLYQISTKVEVKSEIKHIMQVYRVLGQTVQIFNELFGYLIVMLFFHFGIEAVSCLNFFYVFVIIGRKGMPLFHYVLVANLCVIILVLVST